MKNLLFKSKDALLDIVYAPTTWDLQSQWPVRMETNDLLLANAHRWRSLEYDGYSDPTSIDKDFIDLHHLTVPNLNSIALHSFNDSLFFKPPIATRLRHISLAGCSTPWDSCLFSGLETLRLSGLNEGGPPVGQLINFLRTSPGLVTLSLHSLELRGTLSSHADIITLQSLETFEIGYTTCRVVGDFLAVLRIPNCTRFLLTYKDLPDNKLFCRSAAHLFPTLRAIVASCDYTGIEFHNVHIIITSQKRDKSMLEIQTSTPSTLDDWPISMSEGLRNLLGSCSIEKLTLSQRVSDSYTPNRLGRVLELLSEPRDVDGITLWLLPNLKILEIVQGELAERERLINMVRNRYVDRERLETYKPPAKLQSLKIKGTGLSSNWVVINGILGDRVVGYSRPSSDLES
ncbi:hypothetical protein FRB93_000964 [Tulasnella sp. JGI-2019a]|nr:hypothetical protein FRB93_000964 [Tulasnella sp. JGI-2019a]